MEIKNEFVGLRMDPDLKIQLQKLAKASKKNLSEFIIHILKLYLSGEETKRFEKETGFVGRLWKHIEFQSDILQKMILETNLETRVLTESFRKNDKLRPYLEQAEREIFSGSEEKFK